MYNNPALYSGRRLPTFIGVREYRENRWMWARQNKKIFIREGDVTEIWSLWENWKAGHCKRGMLEKEKQKTVRYDGRTDRDWDGEIRVEWLKWSMQWESEREEEREKKRESWTCPSLSYGGWSWRSQRRGAKDRSRGRERERRKKKTPNPITFSSTDVLINWKMKGQLHSITHKLCSETQCLSRQHFKSAKTHSVFLTDLATFRIFSRHVKTIYIQQIQKQ